MILLSTGLNTLRTDLQSGVYILNRNFTGKNRSFYGLNVSAEFAKLTTDINILHWDVVL